MSAVPLNASARVEAVIHNMSFEAYCEAPGLNQSGMKRLHPTPSHFLNVEEEEKDEEPNIDFVLGTMVHTLLLDPDAPLPRVAILPEDKPLTTKAGRNWRDEQQAAGFIVLKPKEAASIRPMVQALARHKLLSHLLRAGHSEVSYFSTYETLSGPVVVKGRVDFVPDGQEFLIDIKTAAKADPYGFQSAATKNRYYAQAPNYLDLHNRVCPDDIRTEMLFFVVEKKLTYRVACYRLTDKFLALGRKKVHQDIETYAACLRTGVFKGYPDEPVPIEPPRFLVMEDLYE